MLHVVVRGQNVLHVLGQFGKDNAAAIFDLILECRPQFPIDQLDANGNTGMCLTTCGFLAFVSEALLLPLEVNFNAMHYINSLTYFLRSLS